MTTVAIALLLLNDPFVRRQSLNLAERLLRRDELDDLARVNLAFKLALSRAATAEEVSIVKAYLAEYTSTTATRAIADARCTCRPNRYRGRCQRRPTDSKKPAPPVNPDEAAGFAGG